MSRHTQGPWKTHPKRFPDHSVYAEHELGFDLATVHGGGREAETQANALLIAAAPELLTACELALSSLRAAGFNNATVTLCEIAIAKARGRWGDMVAATGRQTAAEEDDAEPLCATCGKPHNPDHGQYCPTCS